MEEPKALDQMESEEEEEEEEADMDHTPSIHPSLPTSVIVSVSDLSYTLPSATASVDSIPTFNSNLRVSPGHSPLFQVVSPDHLGVHHLLSSKQHLQVRQTLSEPGRNGRGHKVKVARLSPTRLSPIQPRKNDLSKTLSMGASLDATSNPVLWKPVESTGQHVSHVGVVSGVESDSRGEDYPTAVPPPPPSITPLPISAAATTRLPYMIGSGGQIPTQEQLEAVYKQLPSSSDQLELMQKQTLALMEQQQKMASLVNASQTSGTGSMVPPAPPEMIQMPLLLFGMPGMTPFSSFSTPSGHGSATPSPTSSTTSNDSGISGISQLSLQQQQSNPAAPPTREPLSLGGVQRRPLSESQSAPGFQSVPPDTQFEALQKQFQAQQHQLLLQSQQMQQHYLEQQQRLLQQAVIERKQFEDQQRQLSTMHLHQQSELHKKQQVLCQMKEAQMLNMQRQQQMLLLHNLQKQQQRQASQLAQVQQAPPLSLSRPQTSPQLNHKAAISRVSLKESVSLPYSKPSISATSSNNSLQDGEMSDLQGKANSPNLTPKNSLTPTNSYDSAMSNNGRASPSVSIASPSSGQEPPQQGGTGLVYDSMMLKHGCGCGGSHPEHPGRLQSIWARLMETRVVNSCRRLRARKASLAELQTIHSENHVRLYARPSQRRPGQEKKDTGRAFIQLSCGGVGVDRDTYWNDAHTSNASRMAVGSVIELADKVVNGEVRNGFAFVRPPGHHALPNQAQAFCYFNNVALAAKAMLSKGRRVMVLDWDIHHGNGTQQIFYDNPNVLCMSIHRYDNGTFFPGTGRPDEIGSGAGVGFNVNIAFSGTTNYQGITASNFGDTEYLSAFRSIVIPIAREFDPELILVSAGFNATEGHPPTLGGYSLSPKCYAHLTRMLMGVGSGRVAMALEGGYDLMSLCESAESCMKALLGMDLPQLDSTAVDRVPQPPAVSSLEKTINYHKNYWQFLSRSSHLIPLTHTDAEKRELEESDTVSALASLSVGGGDQRQRLMAIQTVV